MQWGLRGGCAMSTSYETYPYRPLPRRRHGFSPALLFVFFLIGLLALLLVHRLGLFQQGNGVDPNASPRTVTPRGDLWPEEQKVVDLYAKARKAAVAVYNFRDGHARSSGSGFLWDRDGHVVTNAHVIA